jgi:DNA-binding transcriptional LysR family regulator
MPKATVRQKAAELEEQPGLQLRRRTTRTLALTTVGRAFIEEFEEAATQYGCAAGVRSRGSEHR